MNQLTSAVRLPTSLLKTEAAGHSETSVPVYKITWRYIQEQPIPVAARSKAWVRGRSLAGIAGSNPFGGMDVCHL